MQPDTFRVHPPSQVVFLCGGAIDKTGASPVMLRDAFYRIVTVNPPKYRVVLAEDADPLTTDADYKDLLSFESDIAQVVGLIVLFAESAGSLAELGAFAALRTVAPSLLAVVDDFYYDQVSFIRNGPIKYLENEYGDEWVLVLDRNDLGINDKDKLTKLNLKSFEQSISPVIDKRLVDRVRWAKYDFENSGHVILLMTGLCQEFGALTVTEIRDFLEKLGIINSRIQNYLYCAQLLGWIKKVRKGHRIYYVGTHGEAALDFRVSGAATSRDKIRLRADIRSYWKSNEPIRIRAIEEVNAKAGGAP